MLVTTASLARVSLHTMGVEIGRKLLHYSISVVVHAKTFYFTEKSKSANLTRF